MVLLLLVLLPVLLPVLVLVLELVPVLVLLLCEEEKRGLMAGKKPAKAGVSKKEPNPTDFRKARQVLPCLLERIVHLARTAHHERDIKTDGTHTRTHTEGSQITSTMVSSPSSMPPDLQLDCPRLTHRCGVAQTGHGD